MKFDLGPGLNAMKIPALVLAVVTVANIVFFFAVTWPLWSTSAAAGSAALVSEQAHAAIEPALERARRVYGRVVNAEDDLAELRSRVGATSGTVADVVSTLRAAIDTAGIVAERVTYQAQPIDELGITQLQVNLPVRGNYRDLRRFLDELLDAPMFVVLERVSASTPSQNDSTGNLMMALAASVFLDPDAAQPTIVPPATDDDGATAEAPTGRGAAPVDAGTITALADRLRGLPTIPLADHEFDLTLARLDAAPAAPVSTSRNLFSFAEVRARPDAQRPDRTPVVDNFVPAPVMPYDLIGVNRTSEGLLATLVDGDLVLVVGEGHILPDGFRVAAINLMSVTLEAGDISSTIELRPEGED